jgi:hypothetical protein
MNIRPNPQPKIGTIAQVAIQCRNPCTEETGTFLFTGNSHRNTSSVVSPTFSDIWELFKWTKNHDWKCQGASYVKL